METLKTLTPAEESKRDALRETKPRVYEKLQRYIEKFNRKESIAIIQFQYDYACNFSCEHCAVARMERKPRHFALDDVRELSRQGDELGLANFVITGGEPLVFKDLDALIDAIDPQKWYLVMDTNGWALDHGKARYLKAKGVDKIQLSLDSIHPEKHDEFRKHRESFDRAVNAVDAAVDAGLNIILSTVATRQNVRSQDFIDLLEFAKGKGIGTFVTLAKPVGKWEGNFDALCSKEDIAYIDELGKKYSVFTHLTPSFGLDIGCIAVKRMISVTKYGDVMPCPYIHTAIGNFFEEPLADIINRGLNNKFFGERIGTCIAAVSRPFIEKYMAKSYGRNLPIPYDEMFSEEDFIDPAKGLERGEV
jgi:MoaA/NifB/PqqE/SkfB family radical SAM enzyme